LLLLYKYKFHLGKIFNDSVFNLLLTKYKVLEDRLKLGSYQKSLPQNVIRIRIAQSYTKSLNFIKNL